MLRIILYAHSVCGKMPRVLVSQHVVYTGCYRTLLTNRVLPLQEDITWFTANGKENEQLKQVLSIFIVAPCIL